MAFFCASAFAQGVFVTLKPAFSVGPAEIYDGEVVQFELVVINNEGTGLGNFNAVVSVGPQLALVVDGKEKQEQRISFVSLPVGASKKNVLVKGIGFFPGDLQVNVVYGFGDSLATSFSTSMRVAQNPLFVGARLEKDFVSPPENNSVLLDLKNESSFVLKNVLVKIIVPTGFSDKSTPLEIRFFSPSQSVLNASFGFEAVQEISDEPVVLVVSFEDERGPHVVQKNFFLQQPQKINDWLFFAAAIVVIILLAAVYFSSREKPSVVGAHSSVHKKSSLEAHGPAH